MQLSGGRAEARVRAECEYCVGWFVFREVVTANWRVEVRLLVIYLFVSHCLLIPGRHNGDKEASQRSILSAFPTRRPSLLTLTTLPVSLTLNHVPQVVPFVTEGLHPAAHPSLQHAACLCLKALSRSIKVLWPHAALSM